MRGGRKRGFFSFSFGCFFFYVWLVYLMAPQSFFMYVVSLAEDGFLVIVTGFKRVGGRTLV